VDFTYPQELVDFRRELGDYLERTVTPELLTEVRTSESYAGPVTKQFWRRLGADGYFGLGWPVEYGGGGKSLLYLHAFNYEMSYRRLPVPLVTLNTVGPTIIRVGTDEQKQAYLPGILRGEVEFAIGYTEPEAGTDLASLRTTAVRDGDTYVVNGQKVFTSGAEHADYVWLAVRSDPDAPKHKGISVLIVPLSAEGVSVRPLHMMSGHGTTMTFYDNVRVPLSACIGEENRGWYYMTTQLDFERVAIGAVPHLQRTFDFLVAYLRERGLAANGAWTRTAVAAMAADLNALRILDLRVACMVAAGDVPVAEASMLKVLSNEARVTMCANALQILGSDGLVRRGSPGALADASGGTIERQLRESVINLFGGGSNDIQRDIMATHGLGLPR
jgi:alkylation response protein AidB-like acyl-CoA dehydrogenase